MYRKPERLHPGDRIGVFLPASAVKEPFRTRGLRAIRELGFVPVEVRDVFSRRGFLAKEPMRTLRDIAAFCADRDIKALWAGRGGYGSNLLLDKVDEIDWEPVKVVIGSSDVSSLLWRLLDRRRMTVFYGPMVYSALAEGRYVKTHLLRVLTGRYRRLEVRGRVILPGKELGRVTGGCLSSFASLIGTPYMPETRGRILLLEDVNERPYRLDRMLWQVAAAGVFRHIRGLLLGQFPGCFADAGERRMFFGRLRHFLGRRRIPVIGDLPFGHADKCSILPLGVEIAIDTDAYPGIAITEKGVVP